MNIFLTDKIYFHFDGEMMVVKGGMMRGLVKVMVYVFLVVMIKGEIKKGEAVRFVLKVAHPLCEHQLHTLLKAQLVRFISDAYIGLIGRDGMKSVALFHMKK